MNQDKNQDKKKTPLTFALTIFSIACCLVTVYVVKNLNITIINGSKQISESTTSPNETTIPMQTEAPQTETPQPIAETPLPSPTDSPTEAPNLTIGKTNNNGSNPKPKSETNDFYHKRTNTTSSDEGNSTNKQSEQDNTSNSENAQNNNTEPSDAENSDNTITVNEPSQLVMISNSEPSENNQDTITINMRRKTANNDAADEDDTSNDTDTTTSSETDENSAENGNETHESEDTETQKRTLNVSEIINYDLSETNNITYINILPGEYIINFNNTSIITGYYLVPDISFLFNETETTASDENQDMGLSEEPKDTEQQNAETE